jgi:REP element-mobilizing transposase RayT
MYIQAVFAVKFRRAVIEKQWRPELMSVIGNLINETGCKTIIVNGVEDHVHCFFALKPSICVSDVMKAAKAKSSKWVNDSGLLSERFEWQGGFGTFSYSRGHISNVYKYIENQEQRHRKKTFQNEYMKMLDKHGIDYDEQYVFKGLI